MSECIRETGHFNEVISPELIRMVAASCLSDVCDTITDVENEGVWVRVALEAVEELPC